MLKTWSLEYFKSVYESNPLEMLPLTIFTGANSSGKSTILQSILLTTQTIQNSIHSKSVVLNGHIIKLGTFDDILSNNQNSKNITIGFDIDTKSISITKRDNRFFRNSIYKENIDDISINCKFSFSSKSQEDINDISQLHPDLQSSEVQIVSGRGNERSITNKIFIKKSDKSIKSRKKIYNIMNSEVDGETSLIYEVKIEGERTLRYLPYNRKRTNLIGAKLMHFLPERLTAVYDEVQEKAQQTVRFFIDSDIIKYYNFDYESLESVLNNSFINVVMAEVEVVHLDSMQDNNASFSKSKRESQYIELKHNFSFNNFLEYIQVLPKEYQKLFEIKMKAKENDLLNILTEGKNPRFTLDQTVLPANLEFATLNIIEFFSRYVKYLGPLRDEPKPVYPHSGTTDSKDVGFKGEHTAAVLEIHKKTLVEYISPKNLEDVGLMRVQKAPLLEAVLDWLEYMGVVKDVKTVDLGKLGHELKVIVEEGNSFHDLTNVGVGVSQVLPILVLSLLAEKGSTLIFEQPELHLHPRVQTRLADFFVSMIELKKQCIIESHSEYLINRLRYRSVVSSDESISNNVIIYFVEKEKGRSKYKPVKINKYGVIDDWPRGFFDENEEIASSILRAAMEKRKKERKR